MSVLTQGTEIFLLAPTAADPSVFEVLKVACPTAFDPGSESADDIDDTCLDERDTRSIRAGLTSPGEASATINTDPKMASHFRLFELKQSKQKLLWAVGWSDGGPAIVPTVAVGEEDFELPNTRTWLIFRGTLATFPFAFESNSVVQSAMTIKRSGPLQWVRKVGV